MNKFHQILPFSFCQARLGRMQTQNRSLHSDSLLVFTYIFFTIFWCCIHNHWVGGVSSGFFSSSLSSSAGLNNKNIFSHVHNSIKLVTKKRILCITFALQICVELCSKYMQKLNKNRLYFSPPYFLLHT